jgi:hypothetical protein
VQEEGWVVCRAFKKRTAYPARSMALAWDSSFAYRGPNVMVDPNAAYGQISQQSKNARFKQEAVMDGAAAAFLQYSASHLVELPQLESPSAPLLATNASQASTEEDSTGGGGRRRAKKARTEKVSTDWRALDKFVASQLSPADGGGGMEATAPSAAGVGSLDHHCSEETEDDLAALLFLNSDGREEVERWAELLGPAGGDSDLGICVFEK